MQLTMQAWLGGLLGLALGVPQGKWESIFFLDFCIVLTLNEIIVLSGIH